MNQEKYNLNWRTYSDHLREMLHEMMKSNELTDVTLVCDDNTQFKAHKIVLSACSSVFKSIINNLPQSSSVIYLRGIQHQEMESILEFMYLGVATFYQDRMDEFLKAAKNLEIKAISKDREFDEQTVEGNKSDLNDKANDTELLPMELPKSANAENYSSSRQMKTDNNGSQIHESEFFDCGQCESQFANPKSLNVHIQSKHEGVKYACNHCEHQATTKGNLKSHIQRKHIGLGLMLFCNQCNQQYCDVSTLRRHIRSKHEDVKYACNTCEYQANRQEVLKIHIQSQHEGVKYPCNQCQYQATRKYSLKIHIQSQHKGFKCS